MTIVDAGAPAPEGTYAAGRVIHDADAHMVEPDGFYEQYADPDIRDQLASLDNGSRGRALDAEIASGSSTSHHTTERTAAGPLDVIVHKNLDALGAFDPHDRAAALDAFGFHSQLIFNSSFLNSLTMLDRNGAADLSRRRGAGAQPWRRRLLLRRPSAAAGVLGAVRVDPDGHRDGSRGARPRCRGADDPVGVPA